MDRAQQLIAVVEDDAGMRQALHRLLSASGYRTQLYESAEAFLVSGAARGIDCLVLDVQLPGIPGTEMYARLSGVRPPVVFITSHDSPALRVAIAGMGGTMLPKPFPGADLLAAIARAISPGGSP